jgi:hypothetical protein
VALGKRGDRARALMTINWIKVDEG